MLHIGLVGTGCDTLLSISLMRGPLFHQARFSLEDSASQFQSFEMSWLSWAGPPKTMYFDPAKEYVSDDFLRRLQENGIQPKVTARDSHWQLGRTEVHGAILKRMLDRMDQEVPIKSPEEFQENLIQAVCAKNALSRVRALLRRTRPMREPFEEGDWVLYWRRKGGNLRRERGRWYGPARVVQVEGRNVVWLVHANQLVRASPEQLRSASLHEWHAVKNSEEAMVPVKTWIQRIQDHDFFDLEAEELPPEDQSETETRSSQYRTESGISVHPISG